MRFLQFSFLLLAFFATFVLSKPGSDPKSFDSATICLSPNEEFTTCGTSCPERCEGLEDDKICTDNCVRGCFCKKGLVLNSNNKCVTPSKCPPVEECNDPNEEFTTCGTSCPERCEGLEDGKICTDNCVRGCFCKKGLVLNSHNKCVTPSKCPTVEECNDPNEEFTICGTNCPERCGDKPGGVICNLNCVRGCFCKMGLVLNSKNKCVTSDKC